LRTVRGYSVLEAGTRYLPTAAVYIFASAFKGISLVLYLKVWSLRTLLSYISLLSSLAYMALSSGLMTRFNDSTPIRTVVGLQILFSAAAGCGALQTTAMDPLPQEIELDELVLPFKQRMTWYSLAVISEMLGGSIGISVAQTVFMRLLSRGASRSGLALDDVLRVGITKFREGLDSGQSDVAVDVFNSALTRSFYVSTAAAAWISGLYVLSIPYQLLRRDGLSIVGTVLELLTMARR
jgi:hypothetical protein